MALKKEVLTKIATLLKIKEADLDAAIKATDEQDLTIEPTLATFTEAEVKVLKDNEYKNGKTTGTEMAVKDAKEKLGLDFTGKTIDGLVDAATKKALADAKLTPDVKVTELEGKLKTVQTTAADLQKKLDDKESAYSGLEINSEVRKYIPGNAILEPDEVISIMKGKGYDFKKADGKVVVYKDGQIVTDKLSANMAVKDVVESFVKEKKLVPEEKTPGGRGGGNEGGGVKYSKLSELKAKYTSENKSMLGEEFTKEVAEAQKADATFDMNN